MIPVFVLFVLTLILIIPATVKISYDNDLLISIRLPILTILLAGITKKNDGKHKSVPFSRIIRCIGRGIRFSTVYINELGIPKLLEVNTNSFGYTVGLRLMIGMLLAVIDKNANALIINESAVNLESRGNKIALDVSVKTRLGDIIYTVILIMKEKARAAKRKEAK